MYLDCYQLLLTDGNHSISRTWIRENHFSLLLLIWRRLEFNSGERIHVYGIQRINFVGKTNHRIESEWKKKIQHYQIKSDLRQSKWKIID